MVHGRSSLMESLVWLIPFLCVKRREKMKMKTHRDETKLKKRLFWLEKTFQDPQSNPPGESAQNVSKRVSFGRIVPPFFFESTESDRVYKYLHDSNSIFRAAGINSEIFFRLHGVGKRFCKSIGVIRKSRILGVLTVQNQSIHHRWGHHHM